MRGADDRILILVGFAAVAREPFREPVRRADESRLGVEVLPVISDRRKRSGMRQYKKVE